MGAHALGKEEVLLDVKGGAAGTAVAADEADEAEAFGRMAANWKEMGKRRGGKNQNNLSKHISFLKDSDITTRTLPISRFNSKIEDRILKKFNAGLH